MSKENRSKNEKTFLQELEEIKQEKPLDERLHKSINKTIERINEEPKAVKEEGRCNCNSSAGIYTDNEDFGYWEYCIECNKKIKFYYYDEPEL